MSGIRIPVSKADLGGAERDRLLAAFDSGWLSGIGPLVREFEEEFARKVGAAHAVACSSGTAGLHLALAALGLPPGSEVLVPAMTYVATANAVLYCGLRPRFADCDPETGCIMASTLAAAWTDSVKAVVPVHLYGHPCDMDGVADFSSEKGIAIVEDCAEAILAKCRGRNVGSYGDAAVYSFYGNKVMTTGEGGMVTTSDPDLARAMEALRGQGVADVSRRYWHAGLGYNYRMTNMQAAVGLAQLGRLDEMLAARRHVAMWYERELRPLGFVRLLGPMPWAERSDWLFPAVLDGFYFSERDRVLALMAERGVEARPFFHLCPEFRHIHEGARIRAKLYPAASDMSASGVLLPLYSQLLEEDVATVCSELCAAAAEVDRERRHA